MGTLVNIPYGKVRNGAELLEVVGIFREFIAHCDFGLSDGFFVPKGFMDGHICAYIFIIRINQLHVGKWILYMG